MKRILSLSAILVLCLTMVLPANAETLNFYQAINTWDEGFKTFQSNHPDAQYEWSEDYYANTSELAGKLLTRELQSDLLGIATTNIDAKQIMEKGYFLDLSDSMVIRDALDQMVPAIAASAMVNGKIYALPYRVAFDYWEADQAGWDVAELDIDSVPHTYPELLDFLETWCDRIEGEPVYNVRVWNGWDATVYSSSSYTQLLTEMLINSVMMQSEFAQQELSFSAEELLPLLERARTIGQRIYELEPALQVSDSEFGYSLFEPVSRPVWPQDSSNIVSMRIHDDQPELIRTIVTMITVNAATSSPELCIEMVEDMCTTLAQDMKPYLLLHGEAAEKSSYKEDLAKAQQYVDETAAKLQNTELDADTRDELEQDLSSYQRVLDLTKSSRYLVSPEQVADYQQHTSQLYVVTPGVFSPGTDGYSSVRVLEQQFASGLLSTVDFLKQLNDLARMVRLEG